jgi:NADPH-dependent ferric siderophore reductase
MNARKASKAMEESVFTPEELAERTKLHASTIRKLFADQPGVIRLGRPASRGHRRYYTIRVPKSVAERVFESMTVEECP